MRLDRWSQPRGVAAEHQTGERDAFRIERVEVRRELQHGVGPCGGCNEGFGRRLPFALTQTDDAEQHQNVRVVLRLVGLTAGLSGRTRFWQVSECQPGARDETVVPVAQVDAGPIHGEALSGALDRLVVAAGVEQHARHVRQRC